MKRNWGGLLQSNKSIYVIILVRKYLLFDAFWKFCKTRQPKVLNLLATLVCMTGGITKHKQCFECGGARNCISHMGR